MTESLRATPSAAVILLRHAEDGFEILMTQHSTGANQRMGFTMFPGGTVRKDDYSKSMIGRCRGLSPNHARRILGARLSPEFSLGYWVAAIRELFEASGVLLCVTAEGKSLNTAQPDLTQRISKKRQAIIERSLTFQAFLESEGFLCDTSRLAYFSRWLVPGAPWNSLDTRLYLALLGEDQPFHQGAREVTHNRWMTPDRALALHEKGEPPWAFPVFASLRTLADYPSLDALSREYHLNYRLVDCSQGDL